jgi:hypothetical protein
MIKKGLANTIRSLAALATIVTLIATVLQLTRAYNATQLTVQAEIRFAFVWLALFVVCVCGLWLAEKVYSRIPYQLNKNEKAVLAAMLLAEGTVAEINVTLRWNHQSVQHILDRLHNRFLVTRRGSDALTYAITEKGRAAQASGKYFYHLFGSPRG